MDPRFIAILYEDSPKDHIRCFGYTGRNAKGKNGRWLNWIGEQPDRHGPQRRLSFADPGYRNTQGCAITDVADTWTLKGVMSEYQYYEFLAVDRPLDAAEQAALRPLSTRARITATSFVNHYEWGDLKADPQRLMERYFDLFLYLASWGTRRFSIRLPARLIDVGALGRFCPDDEAADVRIAGPHAIVEIWRDEIDQDDWDDDGSGWLAALAPLRGDIIQGDLRTFYLIWLMAVEAGQVGDEEMEPLTGIAPLSAPLRAFADFFCIDPDLIDAAAAEGAPQPPETERAAAEAFIRSLPEEDKAALLLRLHDGDPHLGAELRQRRLAVTGRRPDTGGGRRSAGELREVARRMAAERHRVAAEKVAAERRRREAEQAQARDLHLALLAERGEAPWREVEEQISRRNQPGYERAVTLMIDLGEVARSRGEEEAFARRLADIRARHDSKGRLIERLDAAELR